jgi:hypothetical protein
MIRFVDEVAAYSNVVRIGYARVSDRSQDHQMQLDALAAASCREVTPCRRLTAWTWHDFGWRSCQASNTVRDHATNESFCQPTPLSRMVKGSVYG